MTEWNLSETYIFDGRAVRYGVIGDGHPVVFVHGTPWSSFNMRNLVKLLCPDFTVYYYDLIGYGQSGKSPRRIQFSRTKYSRCTDGFPDLS